MFKKILLCLFCSVASLAFAGETSLIVGISKFTAHGDGVWYQKAFPYELNLKSSSIGLRYDTTPVNNVSYGVGILRLGKVTSSAEAVALDGVKEGDGGYNPSIKACNGPCWPTSHWYGKGQVQGIFGVATKHYGPWSVDAGLYLYKPTWTMEIPDMVWCRECPPVPLTVRSSGQWNVGPTFGVKYKYQTNTYGFSAWHTSTRNSEFPSIYHKMTYLLYWGKTFN